MAVSDGLKTRHTEIKELFSEICAKLDALSHFHFTPKPIVIEASVKSNAPALSMEDPTPVAVSNTSLIAPQEVYHGPHTIKDKEEMSKEERKAHRRHRKEASKKQKEHTDSTPTTDKISHVDALKELKKSKNVTIVNPSTPSQKTSSTKFFSKIQQQAISDKPIPTKNTQSTKNSKSYKL